MAFLAILGALFLFLIVKFIWDEKIVNKTLTGNLNQSNASVGRQNELSTSDRMGILSKLRSSSIIILANDFDCNEQEVENVIKATIFEKLLEKRDSAFESAKFLATVTNSAKKRRDYECTEFSKLLKSPIEPNDTAGGILLNWIQEATDIFSYANIAKQYENLPKSEQDKERKYGYVYIQNIYEATGGGIVIYKQEGLAGHSYEVDELRFVEEFWSNAELQEANDGTGLNVGDELPGICISMVEKTGFPVQAVLETSERNQPDDRIF